jgi:hypothetical protein
MRRSEIRAIAALIGLTLTAGLGADVDLSEVPYLSRSDDYRAWVDGQEKVVYESRKNGNHGSHGVATMSFVGFDLAGRADVRVRSARTVQSFEIRPYSAGVTGRRQGDEIAFVVDRPQHLVLRINDSYDAVLVICVNRPHRPPAPADVEHYYGPGVHRIGIHKRLASGADVYIADGAVVEGSFAVEHAENVTIRGRGIIACGRYPHQEDFQVIRGHDTRNVLIEGITICNAPGWIISFWSGSEDLTVRNVKTIGSWLMNSDGVQTGTVGLLVEDCFLQCNDDNFSLNGQCRDVEIRDCLLWNIYNGGVFMLGWGCKHLENIHIHDCVVFRAGGCCEYDRKAPFSMKLFRRNGIVRTVRFSRIVVEDVARYGRWIDFQMNEAGTVDDITFEDIDILKMWETGGELNGHSPERPIEDVSFRNLRIEGRPIEGAAAAGLNLIHTRDVRFQGRPATP